MFQSLTEALGAIFGPGKKITGMDRVPGGDINRADRLTLSDGTRLFMKANSRANLGFFTAEAEGLDALAGTGAIGTPAVLGLGTDDAAGAFLLLEWVDAGPRAENYWENFGRALAAMHAAKTPSLPGGAGFGFVRDNFIGAGPQINTPAARWTDFFRDCRLAPMLARAVAYLDTADRRRADRLLDRLAEYLPEPEHPSLLHGDLWSGNFITGSDGEAWLIDPAVYLGHAEADLAMTELFGGFSPAFRDAYREVSPLQPGYADRRDLYNLYHLLNHLNLFGSGYLEPVLSTLRRYA